MFRNILSNALKFTPSGGIVTVTIMISDDRMLVEVQDSGVGISVENQKRLFNEVIQFHAKAHQGGGGSGLGLWISKKIIDMHGGSIGVRSEGEGRGCTFYFSLPIMPVYDESNNRPNTLAANVEIEVQPESIANYSSIVSSPVQTTSIKSTGISQAAQIKPELEKSETARYLANLDAGSPGFVNLRVLVVDDSALNRKMMVNRLAKLGCSVSVADDGDTAVALVQQTIGTEEGYDVITMDNVR